MDHRTNSKKAAVVGLGYVGLPLAMHIAGKGIPVLGFDQDERKLRLLKAGRSYIPDVADRAAEQAVNSGMLSPERPSEKIAEADLVIVCVPTPLNARGTPDLYAMKRAASFVASHLRQGQTVVFESSTFPGTLEEVVLPIMKGSGLEAGKDYFLGYSPERIDPGNELYAVEAIPKVVSGLTDACLAQVKEWYGQLFATTVPVSSPRVAEACKLIENIQRLVNISLVNELDSICERMGIDVWETLSAASTKPFGYTPYWPGPGIGGHCIPVDPMYFQWKAQQYGPASRLIETAHRINEAMPARIAARVVKAAGGSGEVSGGGSGGGGSESSEGRKALVIGLAYKKDVNDIRESPAIDICKLLAAKGFELKYHDPHVPDATIGGRKYVSTSLTPRLLRESDVVVILTDHTAVDWELVRTHAKRVVDTRGVLHRGTKGRAG